MLIEGWQGSLDVTDGGGELESDISVDQITVLKVT